jgi:hypothetical protein
METISNTLKGIIGTLASEVSDANKEYVTEKITLTEKKENIKGSLNVAEYRIINLVKIAMSDVIVTLKKERVNPIVIERLKTFINDQL